MSSGNEIMVPPRSGDAMTVYDRIAPMEFVEKFGKVFWITGAGGAKTKEEGELLALACLCERKTIFEINREFHLMDGKLSMRADAMLAKFRERGGKHKWINTGDDGIEAECEFTFDGQTQVVRYSIEDAKRAGLVKEKGNWIKTPGNMLRSRVVSNAIRMIAPEVVAGYYTPEENEDIASDRPAPAASAETKAAVKSRAKELKEMNQGGQGSAAQVQQPIETPAADPDADVIDASFTVTPDPAPIVETPPTTSTPSRSKDATQPNSSETETLMEIEAMLSRAGSSKVALEEQLRKKDPAFTSLDSLSEQSALRLLANLEAKVNAAKK